MLLDQFLPTDVTTFHEDFKRLTHMATSMNDLYDAGSNVFMKNSPIFEKYTKAFTDKYKNIIIIPLFDSTEKFIQIFFDEKSLLKVFFDVIAKTEGLVGVGPDPLDMANVNDRQATEVALKSVKSKLYVRFAHNQSIMLRINTRYKLTELIYDPKTIGNQNDPSYKLCAFFALNNGYDHDIDLEDIGEEFVFSMEGGGMGSLVPSK